MTEDELHDFLDCFYLVYPDVSDTFHYASADAERIYVDDREDEENEEGEWTNQQALVKVYLKYGQDGIFAYVASMRGYDVIEPRRTEQYEQAKEFLKDWKYEDD